MRYADFCLDANSNRLICAVRITPKARTTAPHDRRHRPADPPTSCWFPARPFSSSPAFRAMAVAGLSELEHPGDAVGQHGVVLQR